MSAIVGIVRFDGVPVHRESVENMLTSMPHRGPDGSRTDVQSVAGFGHNMLFTTEESRFEALPLRSENRKVMITCDARIDNREELLLQLNTLCQTGKTVTDADIILHCYEKWGVEFTTKLVGVFSVAIWDEEKSELICFRDIIGLKPLYYFHSKKFFAFSTEIKALLTLDGVPNQLNELRVGDHLTEFRLDPEITIYQEIFRVPPAHIMSVRASGKRLFRYGSLKPDPSVAVMDEANYLPRFIELMTEAVKCRLRSAYPVASQLSGGLDSSYITCLARELLRGTDRNIKSISMIFDEIKECDERSFIQLVLDEGHIEPIFLHADQFGPLTDLNEIYDFVDDGLCSGNHHLVWRMLRLAKEHNCRIVLDGLDGDSTVDHGIGYFRELVSVGEWDEFASEVRLSVNRHKTAVHRQPLQELLGSTRLLIREYAMPQLEKFAKSGDIRSYIKSVLFLNRTYNIGWRLLLRKNWFRLFIPHFYWKKREAIRKRNEPLAEIIDGQFAEQYGLVDRREKHRHRLQELAPVRERQTSMFNSGYPNNEYESTEHYAAAHQIELRHPFMDQRLIEFCLALPASQSFSDGWSRHILRRAMEQVVPFEICWRTGKGSMRANFTHGLFIIDQALLEQYSTDTGQLSHMIDHNTLDQYLSRGIKLPSKELMSLAATVAISFWLKKKFSHDNSSTP